MSVPNGHFSALPGIWLAPFFNKKYMNGPIFLDSYVKGTIFLTSWYMHIFFAQRFFEAAYPLGIAILMLLFLSRLLTTWLQCLVSWPIIVDGKNSSGSIDTNWIKPNFTWIIHSFWSIFTRKFYLAFNNTALRSNLTPFPRTNTNVSTIFFLYQQAHAQP